MPAMIVAAVITGEELPEIGTILSILEVSVVFYLLAFAFVLLVPRFLPGTPGQKGVWRYALAFPNVGFIGYPVAVALFRGGGAVLRRHPGPALQPALLQPGAAAAGGRRPVPVEAALRPLHRGIGAGTGAGPDPPAPPGPGGRRILDFTGGITVPLSLLVVGSLLAGMPAGQVFRSPRLWVLTAIRLLVLPATLCLILHPMELEPLVLGIAVTQMAMPAAVNGTLLSMEYGGDTGVHGPDHLPDHGVLHRHHPHRGRTAAVSGEKELEMPHIQQLESHVADLIAAGEVVGAGPQRSGASPGVP